MFLSKLRVFIGDIFNMPYKILRKALYNLVWSKPLKYLASDFGISDTALRKKCKKAAIPLPTAGYWAKKPSCKSLHQPPLSSRLPGHPIYIEIDANYRDYYSRESVLNRPIPPYPEYGNTLLDIKNRIVTLIGTVTYPSLSTSPHPLITKILNEDVKRKKEAQGSGYSWLKARFTSPIQKRKLRIINALFLNTNKVSSKPYISISKYDDDIKDVSIQIGECSVLINLIEISKKFTINNKAIEKTHLKLTLGGYSNYDMEIPCWEDDENKNIEKSLPEIVIEIIYGAEIKYRAHEQWKYEIFLKNRNEYIEEDKQNKIEEEQLKCEEIERLQQSRINELLVQADNLQKAQTIRNYVRTIELSSEKLDVTPSEISRWCAWALNQANILDPVLQHSFLEQLREDSI